MQQIMVIAGSDPSGGAGLQIAERFFKEMNYYSFSVVTAITAQNTRGVQGFEYVKHPLFLRQLSSIISDFRVDLINLGMIGEPHLIYSYLDWFSHLKIKPPVVFDPVLRSSSGKDLFSDGGVISATRELLKEVTIVSPNFHEAQLLTGCDDHESMVKAFRNLGVKGGVITGGDSDPDHAVDYAFDQDNIEVLSYPKIKLDTEIHGTGSLFSAAVSYYFLETFNIIEAIRRAKARVTYHIRNDIKKLGSGYYLFVF